LAIQFDLQQIIGCCYTLVHVVFYENAPLIGVIPGLSPDHVRVIPGLSMVDHFAVVPVS
jgi:hypothetical protein